MAFTDSTFSFITGPAGCGKTYLVQQAATRGSGIQLAASTGIAAVNLGGATTINSLLAYFDTKSLQEAFTIGRLTTRLGRLWQAGIRRIVLDEVSMVDAEQITYLTRAIEEVNGRGYVLDSRWRGEHDTPPSMGLTLVGDFCQLSPVKAAYAFESPEWEKYMANVTTLTEIKRQGDRDFVEALRAARRGDGARAVEYFAPLLQEQTDDTFNGPTIFAKNDAVDRYNQIRFDRISAPVAALPSERWGKQRSEWGNPEKPPYTWGIPLRLPLKVGALVMILANEWAEGPPPKQAIYVNGDLGDVVEIDETNRCVSVQLQRTGEVVDVYPITRQVTQPLDTAKRKEMLEQGLVRYDSVMKCWVGKTITDDGKFEVVGEITYTPIRLAWATSTHKSQGLSLDRVQINIRDPFFKTPAMLYVALSRARTPQGLRIVGSPAAFVERCKTDPRLAAWL